MHFKVTTFRNESRIIHFEQNKREIYIFKEKRRTKTAAIAYRIEKLEKQKPKNEIIMNSIAKQSRSFIYLFFFF